MRKGYALAKLRAAIAVIGKQAKRSESWHLCNVLIGHQHRNLIPVRLNVEYECSTC